METHDDNSVADGTPPPPWDRELWLRWLGGIIAGVVLLYMACRPWLSRALGHPTWFIQTSSPLCPPSDMAYLFWPSIGVLLTAALLAFRFVLKYTWRESTVRSIAAMAFGIVVHFIALGLLGYDVHLGSQLFGPSGPPFAGWGWQEKGSEFVLWNLVIVAAWLVTLRICMCSGKRVISRGRRMAALLICFCVYAGMLLPYLLTPGHLAHGQTGLRVRLAENNAGIDLCVAMVQYARDHDDRLPRAQSADELAKLLAREGYYTIGSHSWAIKQSDPYRIHCPIQMAREPNPETLVFNTEYSGMAQKEFRRRMDEFDQMAPTPSLPLTCVAHPRDDKAKYRAWGDLRLALINSDHSKGKHASQAE